MKKIIYLNIIITVLLVFTGCEKFLDDTKVVDLETKISGFYLEEHADQAMVAIYADMRNGEVFNGREGHVLYDCGSIDMKLTQEITNNVNKYTFSSSSDDKAFTELWNGMYSAIGRCNSALELVPGTSAPKEKISRYNSEAKVIRAILYYHLMMTYKTCPLVLKTIDPGDAAGLKTGDASREEIYKALIADLEEVVVNKDFPWEKNISKAEKGHVGQGTARTILTYLYLTRGWENNSLTDFENAKKYAFEIIDQGGYSLEPVLLDAYYKSYSNESIFEIATSNIAPGLGSHVVPWFVPNAIPKGSNPVYYGGWNKMCMTQLLYDAIEVGDVRRYLLINGEHGDSKIWAPTFLGGDKYEGNLMTADDWDDPAFGLPTYTNAKATGAPKAWRERLAGSDVDAAANWVVYRLSDVYLLYAEACIKTNADAEARIYINKVRERARNAWYAYLPVGDTLVPAHIEGIPADIEPSIIGDELLAKLKLERRIELCGEMKKMIDVRRWSLGGAKDLENEVSISAGGVWSDKFTWYPKPQDEVDLTGGNIKQNDGY